MFFSPDALKRPHEGDMNGQYRAEKGRLVNVPRRKMRRLSMVPRLILTLLSK